MTGKDAKSTPYLAPDPEIPAPALRETVSPPPVCVLRVCPPCVSSVCVPGCSYSDLAIGIPHRGVFAGPTQVGAETVLYGSLFSDGFASGGVNW